VDYAHQSLLPEEIQKGRKTILEYMKKKNYPKDKISHFEYDLFDFDVSNG
jgi:hypothetical protein